MQTAGAVGFVPAAVYDKGRCHQAENGRDAHADSSEVPELPESPSRERRLDGQEDPLSRLSGGRPGRRRRHRGQAAERGAEAVGRSGVDCEETGSGAAEPDEEDAPPPKQKSTSVLPIVAIVGGVLLLLFAVGGAVAGYFIYRAWTAAR